MEKKRTYETGSYVRIDENKVRLFVSAGTGIGNKRQRRTRTVEAKTDAAAERALKKFIQEVGAKGGSRITLNVLLDEFEESHISGLRENTQGGYKNSFIRIRAALGHVVLAEMQPAQIEKFYRILADPDAKPLCKATVKKSNGKMREVVYKNGLSEGTILQHHSALATALHWGYAKGYTPAPIIDRVNTPTWNNTTKADALSEEQIDAFFATVDTVARRWGCHNKDSKEYVFALWRTMSRVILAMGTRRGEALGLHWTDLTYPNMKICRSLHNSTKPPYVVEGPVKTKTSNRTLGMPENIVALLQEWRKIQLAYFMRHGLGNPKYVFCQASGKPFSPNEVTRKYRAIFLEASIEDGHIHTLRHTCATHLLSQGIPANDVAAFMGHSSAKTTLDVYGHVQAKQAANCTQAASSLVR